MAPATLLPLATFLLHSVSFVLGSSKIKSKYLSSDTCSYRTPPTPTIHSIPSSQFNTINLISSALTLRSLLLHTLTKCYSITFRFCSSFALKRSNILFSPPLQKSHSYPPHPHTVVLPYHTPSVYLSQYCIAFRSSSQP